MSPAGLAAAWIASFTGFGLGILGFVESAPVVAGGGFAITVSLQLWTMTKLGPINVRLAVIEERLSQLEADGVKNRRREMKHDSNPIE